MYVTIHIAALSVASTAYICYIDTTRKQVHATQHANNDDDDFARGLNS